MHMAESVSVQQLLGNGVSILPHEAVAIVQQLLQAAWDATAERAIRAENVLLGSNGEVRCESCAAPSTADIGWLLENMLPAGVGVRVPGALRLTIARACGAIAAPPFSSLAALSGALERFEQSDRRDVVRQLTTRSGMLQFSPAQSSQPAQSPQPAQNPKPAQKPGEDRRRRGISRSQLRRDLRDADARLFALLAAMETPPAPSVQTIAPPRRRAWYVSALAALPLSFFLGYGAMRLIGDWTVPSQTRETIASRADVGRPASSDRAAAGADETLETVGLAESTSSPHQAAVGTSGLMPAVAGFTGPQFSPAFSPSGSAIYFHTGRTSDRHSALMFESTSDAQSAVRTVVDDGSRNYHIQPSPDGRTIAFDSDRDGERGVYLANADGTDVRRVTGSEYAAVPTWAPDGRRLTFIRGETDHPRVWNLWLLSLDTGESRRLTNYSFGQTWSASWLPDSTSICYAHEDRIIVMNVHTGTTREYLSPIKGHIVRTPAVSPRGDRVVFQVYRSGVWMLHLGSGTMKPILSDATAEEFAWSPDARRIAFHSRRSGQWQIWTMTPSGMPPSAQSSARWADLRGAGK